MFKQIIYFHRTYIKNNLYNKKFLLNIHLLLNMKTHLPISLVYIFITLKLCTCELLGVIQVNRHGARTGKNWEEKTSDLFYGTGNTQLTINGYKQHEALGQWIAERYISIDYQLLNKHYNKEEILFISSPSERTIFSAAGLIKGIFPHSQIVPIFERNINSQIKMKENDTPPISGYKLRIIRPEVSLFIQSPDKDDLFHATDCKLNDQEVSDLFNKSPVYDFTEEEIRNAVDDIKRAWPEGFSEIKENIYTIGFLKKLNSFLKPLQYHFDDTYINISKSTDTLFKKIQAEKWYTKRLEESKALKLSVSKLYTEFLEHINHFVYLKKLKFVAYSGHDSTIISIIVNLLNRSKLREMLEDIDQHYNFIQPEFASSLLFELHSLNKNFLENKCFIRIIYNGQILRDGFDKELVYDSELDGIEMKNFTDFLRSRIDKDYMSLKCSASGDEELRILE
jgi:hypothetical protein